MKNSRRFSASALVVFVLLFLIVSQPVSAARKRCPVRIPDSLLTLYVKSDLIVRGSMASGKFLKKTNEYDYGYYFDTEINLRVSKTLKGLQTDSAAFVVSEFKSAKSEENNEENNRYGLSAGDEALFFLVKNDEDGSYGLADYSSGVKPLDAAGLDVYAKRIEELNRIAATKKNQIPKLTEWLVRIVESSLTRGEGLLDLNDSFEALDSKREDEADEEANEEKAVTIKTPIVLDKNFRAANTPEIAELLTDSQKHRLSNEFLNLLGEDLLKINRGDAEEEIYPDYRFTNVVGRWDKNSLAMSSFGFLQNADDSNPRRNVYLMRVIGNFLEDENLYEIISEYDDAVSEPNDAKTDYTEESTTEESEAATAAEEINTEESESTPQVETISETESQAVEKVEETPVIEQEKKTDEAAEKPTTKITFKEYREKLLAKFSRQYGIAVSQTVASN